MVTDDEKEDVNELQRIDLSEKLKNQKKQENGNKRTTTVTVTINFKIFDTLHPTVTVGKSTYDE